MKHLFVSQFPIDVQKEISSSLYKALEKSGLSGPDLFMALKDALSSKLVDLEDTIDINPYLQMDVPLKPVFVSPKLGVEQAVDSLEELKRLVYFLHDEYDLGARDWDWTARLLRPDRSVIGRVSYNGRVWDERDREILSLD